MADSILFSFTRVDRFLKLLINDSTITTDLFDGTSKNFRVVLAESCPDNIDECLNSDGTLDSSKVSVFNGTGSEDGLCSLVWADGVNNNCSISVANSNISWNFGDNTYLFKAAFLVVASTGRVLCYSINNAPIPVKTGMNSPIDGMIWSVVSSLYEG